MCIHLIKAQNRGSDGSSGRKPVASEDVKWQEAWPFVNQEGWDGCHLGVKLVVRAKLQRKDGHMS